MMTADNISNALTGREAGLYGALERDLAGAKSIKINVSFVRESGAEVLAGPLKKAVLKGAELKILTSTHLNITEPPALYILQNELGKLADIRISEYEEISFHPKAYFFEKEDESILFVGSSNISYSALFDGVEWNYRLQRYRDEEAFREFEEDFDDLFYNHARRLTDEFLREYSSSWKKPGLLRKIDAGKGGRRSAPKREAEGTDEEEIKPRGAQHEALYELSLARQEGVEKGLVAAATGVGKTYLAGFDSMGFDRILFVAHREEILKQTEKSFGNIARDRDEDIDFTYFKGNEKNPAGDVVLGSVQTLRKEIYLEEYFAPDDFDYIVVDEFHHAAADSYLNVLDYFEPDFLLGLTATPYRMDSRDIFALCNDNIIYEINLREAINRDLLVPFNYYGIYDVEVDYDDISYSGGRYNQKELEKNLSTHRRAELIYEKYCRLGGQRTLGFCATIDHARFMANYFNDVDENLKAVCVHSSGDRGEHYMKRDRAVSDLEDGDIDIIFAVDIFNEGVDIPALDTVLFLRPTESYVVFLQQLGRGLRKHPDKEELTVLDFIGNYRRAHFAPLLLAGKNPMEEDRRYYDRVEEMDFPQGCSVNFDFKLLDLFEEMKKSDPLEVRIKDEYYRLKDSLGRRPLRYDVYTGSDIDDRHFTRRKYEEKDGYLRLLWELDELVAEEESWLNTPAEDFLLELEKTSMSKSYKMPVLLSLVKDGELQVKASLDEVGRSFMNFYRQHSQHQKDLNNKKHEGWQEWGLEKFRKEAVKNPVKFLGKREFFIHDEINEEFRLHSDLEDFVTPLFTEHYLDIIEYRKTRYFRRRFRG